MQHQVHAPMQQQHYVMQVQRWVPMVQTSVPHTQAPKQNAFHSRSVTPRQPGKEQPKGVLKSKVVRQEYRPKEKTAITIGTVKVPIGEAVDRPIIIEELATKNKTNDGVQVQPMPNDHEANSNKKEKKPVDPRYLQPRWCPSSLSKTAKRRLQRIRTFKKAEHVAEKKRDGLFNELRPVQLFEQMEELKAKEDTDVLVEVVSILEGATSEVEEAPKVEEVPVLSSSHDAVESSVVTQSSPMKKLLHLGMMRRWWTMSQCHRGRILHLVLMWFIVSLRVVWLKTLKRKYAD